jgi:hypothetical protein
MTKGSFAFGTSAVFIAVFATGCASAPDQSMSAFRAPITVQDVNDAQQGWCDALLRISKAYAESRDYKTIATAVLSNNYNYDNGMVLFNPTLTFGDQNFRLSVATRSIPTTPASHSNRGSSAATPMRATTRGC